MIVLERARERLLCLCKEQHVEPCCRITVRPLSPDEAIGRQASYEFPIQRGKERVIEAVFREACGQAFTDRPRTWDGTVDDLLHIDLSNTSSSAVFVAGMNAVLRALDAAAGTVHCRDEDPGRCGPVIAEKIERDYGSVRIGLIGLQPAILAALAWRFSPDRVRVTDLNPDNVGKERSGVPVWDGSTDLARLVEWCDVGLATGSTIVNGSIDEITERFGSARKPLAFFGNTISGAAALLGLRRICPFGR